jgi:hypothetical protein
MPPAAGGTSAGPRQAQQGELVNYFSPETVPRFRKGHKVCRIREISGGPLEPYKDREVSTAEKQFRAFFFAADQLRGMQTTLLDDTQKTLGPKYQAGHLIATTFGGPASLLNLVPLLNEFNNPPAGQGWGTFEDHIRDALKDNKSSKSPKLSNVTLKVTLQYADEVGIARYIPKTLKVVLRWVDNTGGSRWRSHTFLNAAGQPIPKWVDPSDQSYFYR